MEEAIRNNSLEDRPLMQLEDDHPYIGQSVVEECGVRPPAAPYLLMFLLHRFTRVYDKILNTTRNR